MVALPELTFVGFTEDTSDSLTHTFTNHAIGAADATRRVVVCAHGSDAATAMTFSSITIGGNAATIHVQGASSLNNVAIASLLVAAGTTATIVVTKVGGTPDRCAIGVYRAINETVATPNATLVDETISSGLFTGTIAIPANGWVVACCQPSPGITVTGATWTGVTEQYDGAYGDASAIFRTGGFASGLAVDAARTVSCDWVASTDPTAGKMAAVSWG